MVVYANEVETKEKLKLPEIKTNYNKSTGYLWKPTQISLLIKSATLEFVHARFTWYIHEPSAGHNLKMRNLQKDFFSGETQTYFQHVTQHKSLRALATN